MSHGAFPFYEIGVALREIRKSHSDINYGGCGVFAALLGEALHNAGYEVSIRMAGYTEPPALPLRLIREHVQFIAEVSSGKVSVRHWNKYGVDNGHVFVKVRIDDHDWLLDSDGLHEYDPDERPSQVDITLDDLLSFVWNPAGWNSEFDRKQIPTLKKKVNKLIVPILKEAVA